MSRPGTGAAGVAVVSLLLLGAFALLPTGTTSGAPRASPVGPSEAAYALQPRSAQIVHAAVSSLNHGAGPARGEPGACAVSSGGQATCGVGPGRAAPPSASPRWFDVVGNISTHSRSTIPAVRFSGLMAYDPLLSEVVLFNGCSQAACPDTQTWVYNGSSWTNLTSSLTSFPPARQGSGMDFDPLLSGVVLFAGEDLSDNAESDTWLFTSAGWSNITSTVGKPHDSGGAVVTWAWGGMAWDPALHGIVAVDGCKIGDCRSIANVWDQTWLLGAGGWTYHGPGPGTVANATHLEFNSLAYDARDSSLVSFGGFDSHRNASTNATFTMDASGAWVNITGRDAGCIGAVCTTPPGRESAAMTWDGSISAILMTDGYNTTSGAWVNDSWTFAAGAWFPTTDIAPRAPSGYCPVAQPAMPKVSDNIAPFILGGFGSITPCYSNEWVFEIPPVSTLTMAPNPLDLGVVELFNASWVAGTGTGVQVGWTAYPGDGHPTIVRTAVGHNSSTPFSVLIAHTYGTSGAFVAAVTESDFYYVPGVGPSATVTVFPALTASITASSTSIPPGGSVTFRAIPAGGSGTYSLTAWQFGDGSQSATQNPSTHTFAKVGSYAVDLTVADSTGAMTTSSVMITVATVGFLQGAGIYLVIGIVGALAVVAGLVWVSRRRKRTTTSPATEPRDPPSGAPVDLTHGPPH